MNENLIDPQLRTFRMPITHRLREKIDALRAEKDALTSELKKRDKEIARLQRELRVSNRQYLSACREIGQLRHAKKEGDKEGENQGGMAA